MNDIGRKDVETYVRRLISEEFGRQAEDIEDRERQADEEAHAPRRSGPDASPPTRKEKSGDACRN